MKPLYVDASIVLSELLGEKTGSFRLSDASVLYSSDIIEVEVFRTLERARFSGRLEVGAFTHKISEATAYLSSLYRVSLSPGIIRLAKNAFPIPVRALDAIHVATAEWLISETDEKIEFHTHDLRQGEAALSRGIAVHGV